MSGQIWFGFRNTSQHTVMSLQRHPASYWRRKTLDTCQTYVRVEPPAHRRSAGKPLHNKVLTPTRTRTNTVEGLGISSQHSQCMAMGPPVWVEPLSPRRSTGKHLQNKSPRPDQDQNPRGGGLGDFKPVNLTDRPPKLCFVYEVSRTSILTILENIKNKLGYNLKMPTLTPAQCRGTILCVQLFSEKT